MSARTLLAAVAVLLAVAPAAVAAAPVKKTYRVPVTAPDESGRAVELDVDVYLPGEPAPPSGRPVVMVFHGGGSNKDNAFDADHARNYAERGYASIIYSARGHGGSSGQVTVAGPKEVRDGFDVLDWAFKQDFALDRRAIALAGYSQGGLHTNLLQAWADDPAINPYGFRFVALEPGNTPDVVFNALVDHDVVKLSFGVGLMQTYFVGANANVSPRVDGWIATALADRPELYGGDVCDMAGHDDTGSTMRADLAARSIGCRAERMNVPTYWMQAFDDNLFTVGMATSMFDRVLTKQPASRLYLSMGGHAALAAPQAVEDEKTELQVAWLDHVMRGAPFREPRVVYWARDAAVPVGGDVHQWPDAAWRRLTARAWPPEGIQNREFWLGADGRAAAPPDTPTAGSIPLSVPAPDFGNDPVAQSAFGATPLGAAPATPAPTDTQPGSVAVFRTEALTEDMELSGAPSATLSWTPASPDTQLVLKVLAEAPDGTLTLLTRGVTGVRGATPGAEQPVLVNAQAFSALLPRGTRLVAWVSAGDPSFYKAYPGSAGGALSAGPGSTLSVPLRRSVPAAEAPPPVRTCADRRPPRSRVRRARLAHARLLVAGTAIDRTCRGDEDLARRGVGRVFVSIARPQGRRCRFVTASGLLLRARSCRRPAWIEPDGATRWSVSVAAGRLPAGRYRASVEAVDVHGNLERTDARNRRWFRVA